MADELQDLDARRKQGVLSNAEYLAEKARIEAAYGQDDLASDPLTFDHSTDPKSTKWARDYAMGLHLSMLLGLLIPVAGLVAPIVMWQIKKDELPGVDQHGKNAVNWIISEIIYLICCIPLMFILIGIPLAIIIALLAVVFPIIAGIKASRGEIWQYPLSIKFF